MEYFCTPIGTPTPIETNSLPLPIFGLLRSWERSHVQLQGKATLALVSGCRCITEKRQKGLTLPSHVSPDIFRYRGPQVMTQTHLEPLRHRVCRILNLRNEKNELFESYLQSDILKEIQDQESYFDFRRSIESEWPS
jgi:hypothetical protein